MATLEVPDIMDPTRKQKRYLMDFNIKFMFWQGFWPEDAEYDLNYYMQSFNPRLARMILRHRYLLLGLSYMRRYNPWFLLTYCFVQFMFIHPVAIYLNLANTRIVVANALPMVFWMSVFGGTSTIFFQKENFHKCLTKLELFSKKMPLDNEEHASGHNLCIKISRVVHFVLVPLCAVNLMIYNLAWCLPQRKQAFGGWYPYDETASPAFEITLFVHMVFSILNCSAGNSIVTITVAALLYIRVYFKILPDKFKNIRSLSIQNIKDRKDCASKFSTRDNNETEIGHNQRDGILRTDSKMTLINPLNVEEHPEVVSQGTSVRSFPSQGQSIIGFPESHHDRLQATSNMVSFQRNRQTVRSKWANVINRSKVYTDEEVDKDMNLQLKEFVKLHAKLLRITNDLSDVLSNLFVAFYLMNILVYGGIMMSSTYINALSIENMKEMLLIFVFIQFVVLFLIFNVLANAITDEVSNMAYKMKATLMDFSSK